MKVLLDTNIIIHREASRVINEDIGTLFGWLDKLKHEKLVHPLTITELNKHVDPVIAKTMQTKLKSYKILQTEAPSNKEVEEVSNQIDKNDNDRNDTKLLNEVYSKRADLLISEDKKLHSKASKLSISDKVFTIDAFLEKVTAENPDFVDYKVLSVKKELFGKIKLSDSFFDSFRQDYIDFDDWFNSKSEEPAYVCYNNEILSAFLFIKREDETENYQNISPIFTPKKRLKIGTLKVAGNGFKLGERFLKIIFDNARQYNVDEIYVTLFDKRPEQIRLINLLEEFGFKSHGTKTTSSGTEKVFVREFKNKTASPQNPKMTYPWLSKETNIYIVPIKPDYHTELLPDSMLRTESPADFTENEPHRNSISKSYISHSHTRNLKSGDILVFYRSGGMHVGVATTIGIVEGIINEISNSNHLLAISQRRTVFNEDELKEIWNRYQNNKPFVINFLYAFSFKKRINLKGLLDNEILPNTESVRTINPITLEAFTKLITLSGI